MRNAKVHKIFLTVAVSVLFLILAILPFMQNSQPALADSEAKASDYFTGIKDENLSFANGNFRAMISEDSVSEEGKEKGVLSFSNLLIVNDMQMSLQIPTGINSLTVVFKNESFFENGNPMAKKSVVGGAVQFDKQDGKYVYTAEKEVVNELKFDFTTGKAMFNGETGKAFDFVLDNGKLVLTADVVDNYLVVNGVTASDVKIGTETVEYRKIKAIVDKSITDIKFMFDVDETIVTAETPANFEIISVNQKYGNADYEQTFAINEDGELIKKARPIVALSEDFYKKNADGTYTIVKDIMEKYSVKVETFSVLDDVSSSDVYLKSDDLKVWLDPSTEKPNAISFRDEGTYTISVMGDENVVYDTFTVKAVNFENDTNAPAYVYNADAYFAFEVALRNAYYNIEKGEHLALGTNMEVPSLKDLVFDDICSYEDLTKMVYSATASKSETMSGSYTVDLDEAGDYYFYVIIADDMRNEMEKEDFIADEDNTSPKYAKYVFNFHMVDDAVIIVKPAKSQGAGYVGVAYTASEFTVEASSCKTTYKLYYNEDVNAVEDSDGWTEIAKASSIKDENYYDGYFTYEDIQALAYDGSLTFTPDRMGAYMIRCTSTSTITSRDSSDVSIIRVESEAEEVKVYSDWFKDNVWTVVFLGVGTLCLIGIVALLFVKPKEEIVE